jgi:hypothetical protein
MKQTRWEESETELAQGRSDFRLRSLSFTTTSRFLQHLRQQLSIVEV